ncbi:hypothetical protein ACFQZ4_12690 [Catellatospora coxensis]
MPPLMAAARYTASGGPTLTALTLTTHAFLWTTATTYAYTRLRRTRP